MKNICFLVSALCEWCHKWGRFLAILAHITWPRACCNLSGGVALIVCFTTNGMCAKNNNTYMWCEQAIIECVEALPILTCERLNITTSIRREIATHDLYCCLLPWCEALRTCRSGFPIATGLTARQKYFAEVFIGN